jgi:murein DD-endopeptidase MepM/ murein hydrolase activator NlpD
LEMAENRRRSASRFTEFLVSENGLHVKGFDAWAFMPGMLFSASAKWWGDRGARTLPHEGVDFRLYTDRRGRVLHLDGGTKIPVMYDGIIVRIMEDFLGKSVVVAHGPSTANATPFLTIYGHTAPLANLAVGAAVEAGEIIATIAPAGASEGAVPPHLHISVGTLSGLVSCDRLEWKNMNDALIMSDPLALITNGRHRLIDHA